MIAENFKIETERLLLRPFNEDDCSAMLKKIRDITRYILLKDIYRDNEGLQQHVIDLRKTLESELPFSEMI